MKVIIAGKSRYHHPSGMCFNIDTDYFRSWKEWEEIMIESGGFPEDHPEETWLALDEVSYCLKIESSAVVGLIEKGDLPAVRSGNHYWILDSDMRRVRRERGERQSHMCMKCWKEFIPCESDGRTHCASCVVDDPPDH